MADSVYEPTCAGEAALDLGIPTFTEEREDRFESLADVEALGLSSEARAVLRWGGYEDHPEATDELVDHALVRWDAHRRDPCYVLTRGGGEAFVLLGGGRSSAPMVGAGGGGCSTAGEQPEPGPAVGGTPARASIGGPA